MKKFIAIILAIFLIIGLFTACTEADKVNANIIDNNTSSELVVTAKVGPDTYKKNYVYLNDYTLYVVEDISGTHTDPYHYKIYFHTEFPLDVETKP